MDTGRWSLSAETWQGRLSVDRRITPSVYPSDDGSYRAVVIITEGHKRHLRYVPGGARKTFDSARSIAAEYATTLEKANVAFVSPKGESIPRHLRYSRNHLAE